MSDNQFSVLLPSRDPGPGVLTAMYIMAALIPIVGLAVAVYCFAKSRPGHGMALLALAMTSWCFWYAVNS